MLARSTVSPEAKLSVPLSVSVVYVLAADGGRSSPGRWHRTTRCPLVHRQTAREDGTLAATSSPWFTVKLPGKT